MESTDFLDKMLNPPEYGQYSDCDGCGNSFDTGDLNHIGRQWLCDDCAAQIEEE